MPRRREEYEEEPCEEGGYEEDYCGGGGGKPKSKRRGQISDSVDDYAEDEEDEEGYSGRNGRRRRRGNRRRKTVSDYFEVEADVDSDGEDEEEEEMEDDFIDIGTAIPDEDDRRVYRRRIFQREDEDDRNDFEEIERIMKKRYNDEYGDDPIEADHQAPLPSIWGSKLWVVKCAIGHEKELAVSLMQKSVNKGRELNITSAIALDHLKGSIYIEACKEAHVREAIKGMQYIYPYKIAMVPIKEMTDIISVQSNAIDIFRATWGRVKIGIYKGDLAKVVDIDNVRQRATVKLIPRIDLQGVANKLEGRKVPNKSFTPPARFLNIHEARVLHIPVERRRDPSTGDYFDKIEGMMFKDGFLYKKMSLKSLSTENVVPTLDELEKFKQPVESGDDDMSSLSALFENRKRSRFVKGDRVIVGNGDLRNLRGCVEKAEEDTVHIKTYEKGLPKTLIFNDKELCKYIEPGNHVKVVYGATEGATGMAVSVEGHVVTIMSDGTKELHHVFADNVVESSEATIGVTRIGDYELHDLVLLGGL